MVTAIPLVLPLLPFLPCTLHALCRVGGRCGGHGNECHGRKPGATDRRKRSAWILCGVGDAEESDWWSGAVASWVRSQPRTRSPIKEDVGEELTHTNLLLLPLVSFFHHGEGKRTRPTSNGGDEGFSSTVPPSPCWGCRSIVQRASWRHLT